MLLLSTEARTYDSAACEMFTKYSSFEKVIHLTVSNRMPLLHGTDAGADTGVRPHTHTHTPTRT